ncbi:MAG: tRNA pseudouridine(38-40) synthase TruA [Candidatus Ranarchaeia archaeon]
MLPELTRYAYRICFIGDEFNGSQRQPDVRTVEGEILKALKTTGIGIDKSDFNFKVAGRTDTGVHALDWVISFNSNSPPNISWINSVLPTSIRIWGYSETNLDFNPRFEAESRTYLYFSPILNQNISLDLINEGIEILKGKHDFRNFSKPSKSTKTTLCNLYRIEVEIYDEHLKFVFTADRFLWHMIRKIVNLLIEIGEKRIPIRRLKEIISDPTIEPFPNLSLAHPGGLILYEIKYPNEFSIFEEGIKQVEKMFQNIWISSFRKEKLSSFIIENLLKK